MRLPRHHEQTRACRSTTNPVRQAAPAQSRRRTPRALAVAVLAAAALAAGGTPALAQSAPSLQAVQSAPGAERIHQALSSSTVEKAISAAESQKGKPYAWGGTGPNSFDCSGLVQYSFKQAGVSLPRIAHDQVNSGTRVSYANAKRGDILYWTDSGGYAYHVAIYLGGGRMIDAPRSGRSIAERDVTRYNLAGAVRI
ncbi:NlpC/P60 family protein [Nocardiopsis exhalans]|uniref:Cell wall-associated NlpC family hydrolase n=2 Tax=Nocardiopsis TaxID=2013 RepID=A0A840WWS4_9ACTN|nr:MULTISPECIES: C40 family peptidase [Nocardiopsis]MBB5494628.1 cell wall-associated NlpC family hydrolase [Nocardiopsis metallicus]USY20933.1 NlpC/P60 family protein [Nocardiopsis exhalans]